MTTAIQWTDRVWNPVVGCTKVSQGCKHCYAKTLHDMRHKAYLAGNLQNVPQYAEPFETVQRMPGRLRDPLGWRKPSRVFVNSMSDLFHEDVPDEYILDMFMVMAEAERHTFQVLTKRPARMLRWLTEYLPEACSGEQPAPIWPLPNVWLGVSVENQAAADERIPLLLQVPGAVRFLSCEPLLGALDLGIYLEYEGYIDDEPTRAVDWVIVGGESGVNARPCDVAWIRSVLAQCRLDNVPVFVKQLGRRPLCANDDSMNWPGETMPLAESYEPHHQGEVAPLDLVHSHGGDMSEWPDDLRIREFPARAVRTGGET